MCLLAAALSSWLHWAVVITPQAKPAEICYQVGHTG